MSSLNPTGREVEARLAHLDEVSRRRFLQVMGASMALASAAGCRWEEEEILPFDRRPSGRIPGKPRRFATAYECGFATHPLLVTSYDGRPIKIEGNPKQPASAGATNARAQASILSLYDPDASGSPVQLHERVAYRRTWDEFEPWFLARMERLHRTDGAGLWVLAPPSTSRTMDSLRTRFLEVHPGSRWIRWQPLDREETRGGAELAFGRALCASPVLERADTVLVLDDDLFGDHPDAQALARQFAKRRDPRAETMLRLWAVEARPSVTGAAADHRLALRPSQLLPFLLALELAVAERAGDGAASEESAAHSGFLATDPTKHFLEALGGELWDRKGRCAITVGPRQPAVVHAVAHRLNARLGNLGTTVLLREEAQEARSDGVTALSELAAAMSAGEVQTLLLLGGNPAYDAPADLDFRRALREVPCAVHLSRYRDETSRLCHWHLPAAHFLESWSDAASHDGTRCTVQPLIDPLFERHSALELVAKLVGEERTVAELVRASVAPDADEATWRRILHDGFVPNSATAPVTVTVQEFDAPSLQEALARSAHETSTVELELVGDSALGDGRDANNAWLQELPDAITKLTWGNALQLAPETAAEFGVGDGDLVEIQDGERIVEAAVVMVPGQAVGSATLALGHGRTAAGVVGGAVEEDVEPVGFDAYRLRTTSKQHHIAAVRLNSTGGRSELARTQDPPHLGDLGDRGRDERVPLLVRETDLQHFGEHPDFAKHLTHHPPLESLWTRREPDGRRWGMSIDLGTCIGCNACVVACQAENNVPVVGREEVRRGREMHWLRIDRYYVGDLSDPKVRFQPMACQHCEAAPCEQVCPVGATMHSEEGLNEMAYNRCIGTRYCANNCPFKVRRFNFFDYQRNLKGEDDELARMRVNPEVTVRPRGVMEKCTFCVQRIQNAKIAAKNADRALQDGEVVPACAQTCPTQAITFGDLADERSRIAAAAADSRSYAMLSELNIAPRTTYLAKIRNPHSALSDHDGSHSH